MFPILFSTSRLHGALGWRPPNLEAVAQTASALQDFSILFNTYCRFLKKKIRLRKGVVKARGRVQELREYTNYVD